MSQITGKAQWSPQRGPGVHALLLHDKLPQPDGFNNTQHRSAAEKSGWACLGSMLRVLKGKIKMMVTLSSYLETLGENPLPSSFGVLAESSSRGPQTEAPSSLLAPGQVSLAFLHTDTLHLQSQA